MLLDNTQRMTGGVKTPVTQLKAMGYRGLMGLGLGLGDVSPPTDPQTGGVVTALNSELAYLVNLDRAQRGLAPLPASVSQPGVTVGLDPGTLLLVGGGLLVLLLALKKK